MVRAVNRKKEVFEVNEEVMMADSPELYKHMNGEMLTITEIEESECCESGFMIQVVHKGSGKPFKKKLDTNWFKKIKNTSK
jgi:hypothetical protein